MLLRAPQKISLDPLRRHPSLVSCFLPLCIYVITAFNEVPSPMLIIVTPNEQHTYLCSHSAADRITWRVNDVVLGLEVLTIPVGIEYTDSISHPDDAIYTLTIRALPQHNETTIQCTVSFHNGSLQRSPMVTFLIQGQLMALYVINIFEIHTF